MLDLAFNLIARYGQSIDIQVNGASTYNSATGTASYAVASTSAKAYTATREVDEETQQVKKLGIWIPAKGLVEIEPGFVIDSSSYSMTVVSVNTVYAQDIAVLYIVQGELR